MLACLAQFSIPCCVAVLQADITMQEGFSDIPAEAAWDLLDIFAPFPAQKLSAIFPGLFF